MGHLIQPLSASALGAYRVTLGIGLMAVVFATDFSPVPPSQQRHYATPDWSFIHGIAANEDVGRALAVVVLVTCMLFTIGFLTRIAYAGLVAALFVATLILLESRGAHDWGLPMVTLLGWLAVPWGDGLSVDEWWRNRHRVAPTKRPASRAYGFAIWWPGLTLGAALFAAAYTKLTTSGLAWIVGGAVKYHFVTDAANAPVTWGLWIARHHSAAVLLSFGAILIEAAFILVILARSPLLRLVGGISGAILFIGLFLFQGIFWPAWLVLLLAFLPWGWLNRLPVSSVPVGPLRYSQAFVIVALVVAQTYAAARRIEAEPLLSNYPMYSGTFESPAQFDRAMQYHFTRVVHADADGLDVTNVLSSLRTEDRIELTQLAEHPVSIGDPLEADQQLRRENLCAGYRRLQVDWPSRLTLTVERGGFDWDVGTFKSHLRVPTSTVSLAALCAGSS